MTYVKRKKRESFDYRQDELIRHSLDAGHQITWFFPHIILILIIEM